jgi:hypothetical protein
MPQEDDVDDRLFKAFSKVKFVQDNWHCYPFDAEKSAAPAKLQNILETHLKVKIVTETCPCDSRFLPENVSGSINPNRIFLRSILKLYEIDGVKEWRISIRNDLSPRWKQFAYMKELFHILIDAPAEYSADGVRLIRSLTALEGPKSPFWKPSDENERIAEFCAMEIMFPYEQRMIVRDELHGDDELHSEYIERLKMPSSWLSHVISKSYNDSIATPTWALIADISQTI